MADEPTNTPPENPAPEGPPENPPAEAAHDAHQHTEDIRRRLDEHDTKLGELEQLLNATISVKGDSSPVKKPWTHRKLV